MQSRLLRSCLGASRPRSCINAPLTQVYLRRTLSSPVAEAWSTPPLRTEDPDVEESLGSRIGRLTLAIQRMAKDGELLQVLRLCVPLRDACREANRNPSEAVFLAILSAFSQHGYFHQVIHTLHDMIHCGLTPSLHAFNVALSASTNPEDDLSPLFEAMKLCGLTPDANTLHHLVLRAVRSSNLEAALLELDKIRMADLTPTLESYNAVALLSLEHGEVRVAHDLLLRAEADLGEDTYAPVSSWFQLLEVAASASYLPGLLDGVNRLQHSDFTEGLLLGILNVAGRHGAPELAAQCIEIIQAQSSQSNLTLPLREWHYAPLIEACCRAGHVDQAIKADNEWEGLADPLSPEDSGTQLHTVLPIRDVFLQRCRQIQHAAKQEAAADANLLSPFDELRHLHQTAGLPIHVAVFNAALLATVEAGQMHQALVEFKQGNQTFSIVPNADTFNILLFGCIENNHHSLGHQLMQELQMQQITPDQTTYERLIQLCLQDGGDLEAAFGYLEALKAFGATPTIKLYGIFLQKLIQDGDARSTDIRLDAESFYGEALTSSATRFGRGTTSKKPKKPRRSRAT